MTEKRSHQSKGIYRTLEEVAALKQSVLDAWADGEHGDDIAASFDLTRDYVDTIVRRARAKGDPRAARRYAETDSYNWHRAVYGPFGERVWNLHCEGKSPLKIAKVLNVDVDRVHSELSRQKLLKTGTRRTLEEWGNEVRKAGGVRAYAAYAASVRR